MITRDQIEAALEEVGKGRVHDLEWSIDEDVLYAGLKLENEEQEGGEGQGDHYHIVTKVTNPETNEIVFIMHVGYYSSYDGASFDDGLLGFDIVEPYEKTVRDWKVVK